MIHRLVTIVFFIEVSYLQCTFGQTCTASFVGGASPDCQTTQKPYCINVSPTGSTAVYQCAQCLSDCDCPMGEYCSTNTNANTAGQCMNFQAVGKQCIAMSSSQLNDPTIPSDVKCADIYTTVSGGIIAEKPSSASCVEGFCRVCNPDVLYCSKTEAMDEPRMCTTPGYFVTQSKYPWLSYNYKQNPLNVWTAVYFPFLIVALVIMILIAWKL